MARDLPIESSKFPSLSALIEYIKSIELTSDQINDEPQTRADADAAIELKIQNSIPDMVVLTSSELNNYSDDPRYVRYDQATKTFKQKGGSVRTPIDGDWTLIKSIETLTDSLDFPVGYDRAKISTDRHFEIPVGNKGTGEPYEVFIGGNKAEVDLILDKDYGDLSSSLTDEEKRTVKNRGIGNRIILNNRQIFSGKFPIEINSPIIINDPYVISQNGDSYEGYKVSGSNDDVCLFRDWWDAWGGVVLGTAAPLLSPPIFNPATGVLQRRVFTDDPAGRFLRLNTPFGGSTGVDPGVHSRTSPEVSQTIATYTSSASAEISGITDADTKKLKIGSRVQATGILGGTTNTTIISSIVHNGTNDNSIFLVDSATGGDAVVSATGNLTIDMSGNSKISHQLDAMQTITGSMLSVVESPFWAGAPSGTGAITIDATLKAKSNASPSGSSANGFNFDSSNSPSAKTDDDESRGISYQRQSYLIL